MDYPKVIFLDAVGTVFGVRGSVGQIYRDLAQTANVDVNAGILDKAFLKHFRAAPPMAFPKVERTQVPAHEYRWWHTIARQTFDAAGVLPQFADFDRFFADVYAYFAKADPWQVYPDTLKILEHWHHQGTPLGVVSNFDSRLNAVLDALDLKRFFSSVTFSTEVGAAKPDSRIFNAALAKHNCRPAEAWHIGDSREQDYEGAKAAGLHGIWIKRKPS
ncbi:MAG: HAD-IA family hydrolase [Cyanobacteria bacterium J06635_15]